MVAVTQAPPVRLQRLAVVSTVPTPKPGVRRVPSSVYHRRRLVAGLVLVAVVAGVVLAVGGLLASFGGGPLTSSERPGAPASVYVVQPGDTFWDIARRLDPAGDPRPLVARLVAAHGSPVLVPGERLALPAAS